ncbi:hypothetical protein MHU86_16635 [Fragilaria crotonensis]|nr:hypothetical protein MHU86_16635 [Fragilaria crotonensis]
MRQKILGLETYHRCGGADSRPTTLPHSFDSFDSTELERTTFKVPVFDVSKFASRGRDALLNGCHNLTKAMPIVSFVLKGHKSSVNCLDYRNNLLLSGSDDQTARIWDVRTSKTCLCLRTTGEVTSVAFAGPQGKEDNVNLTGLPFAKNTSVFLSVENAVLEYDLRQAEVPVINHATRDLTEELKTDDEVNQLCVSKNRLLAAADDSGTVRIWDGAHTRVLQPESEHPFLMTSCCYRSGDQLASGGTNCTVYLWDIGRPRKPLDALLIPRDDVGANQMCNPPMVHALSWSLVDGCLLQVWEMGRSKSWEW